MRAGWQKTPLGEAFTTVTGNTPPKNNLQFYGRFMPLVKPPELRDARLDSSEDGVSEAGAEVARKAPPNAILVSCIGNLGKIGWNTVPVAFNQQINAIFPDARKAIPGFMFYQVLSDSFQTQLQKLASGTTVPIVNKSKFNSIDIVLPSLSEQEKIVAILDDCFEGIDTAVASAEKNLANAREIFIAYLNSIFAQKIDGWEEKSLSELMDITHGYAFDGSDFEKNDDLSKPIVLTPGNYTEHAELNFTPKNTKRFTGIPPAAYLFNPGDLTIVMTDLSSKMKILGKPAFVVQDNILHNQRIGRVKMKNESVILRYVYYFLRTDKVSRIIKETSTGTMVRHTAPKRILAISIPFPADVMEQIKITERLAELSIETGRLEAIYQRKLMSLAELKQVILRKALDGELTSHAGKVLQEVAVA